MYYGFKYTMFLSQVGENNEKTLLRITSAEGISDVASGLLGLHLG
jgi:hypothetical protein